MSTTADRLARAGQHGRATDGHREGVSGTPRGTRPTVVLVDDSKEVRAVVRRLLQSSGFDVVGEGGDGDEAILLAFRHEPALAAPRHVDAEGGRDRGVARDPRAQSRDQGGDVHRVRGARARREGPRAGRGRLRREVAPPGGPGGAPDAGPRCGCAGSSGTRGIDPRRHVVRRASRRRARADPCLSGAGGPERARPAVPRAVRPRGARDGHADLQRHHRPRQPRARRADVVQPRRPRGRGLRPADARAGGGPGPPARGHLVLGRGPHVVRARPPGTPGEGELPGRPGHPRPDP